MAIVIAFGVQTTANAQLGGLVNKAKKAVKDKVENKAKMTKYEAKAKANQAVKNAASEAGVPVSDDSIDNGTPKAGKHPKSLTDLDPQLFIYPLTEDTELYDVTNPRVEKAYVDFCNLILLKGAERRYAPHGQLDFVDYQSPNGLKQIHVTEYPLAAYFSYFMMNPAEISGYQCYIRARLMVDNYRKSEIAVYPYKKNPRQGWDAVYPGAKEKRNITFEDGKSVTLLETENARQQRWSKVADQAEDILHANTPYPVVRSVLKGTLEAIKQCDAAGRPADAYNLLCEAEYMMKDLGSHPLHSKDEQWQDIGEQYLDYFNNKRLEWLDAAGATRVKPVDMPKAASVSADIQNQATAKAKAKYGAKFVKAIVVQSDWGIFKEREYPYNISHRSIAVDVITKEGNDYFVNHEDLRQNYVGGKYGSYDLRPSMQTPLKQKVNYK